MWENEEVENLICGFVFYIGYKILVMGKVIFNVKFRGKIYFVEF